VQGERTQQSPAFLAKIADRRRAQLLGPGCRVPVGDSQLLGSIPNAIYRSAGFCCVRVFVRVISVRGGLLADITNLLGGIDAQPLLKSRVIGLFLAIGCFVQPFSRGRSLSRNASVRHRLRKPPTSRRAGGLEENRPDGRHRQRESISKVPLRVSAFSQERSLEGT